MAAREDNEGLSNLFDICRGISVRPWETDLRRQAALVLPEVPSVPGYRALNALRSIENERRRALSRLELYTRELDVERIEAFKNARVLDALIELQTHYGLSADIAGEVRGFIVTCVTRASDEQVRYLSERGCIQGLCAAPHRDALPAIRRFLEVGEAGRSESGRNLYADQVQGHGGLDWLNRLRQHNGEIEQMIAQFFEAAVIPTQDPEPIASDRALGWRLLYPLLKHGRFPRWHREDVAIPAIEERCPLEIKLFVSHRWATPDDPDPDCKDLYTVVEYLTRVFMVANGFLSEDSHTIKELVIGDRLRSLFHESRLDRCRCGSVGWLDVRSLLDWEDLFFDRVTDIMRRRNFYRLLKHVRVWYDYSSLPQARGTREEEAFLDRALTHLADIVGQSEVLTLWGIESIKRAWCIFEVLAAKTVHFCAPAAHKMSLANKWMFKWALDDQTRAEEAGSYRGRPSPSILITVKQFQHDVTGLSECQIHEYLVKNGIECTKGSDLARLSNLIHRYLLNDGGAKFALNSNWAEQKNPADS